LAAVAGLLQVVQPHLCLVSAQLAAVVVAASLEVFIHPHQAVLAAAVAGGTQLLVLVRREQRAKAMAAATEQQARTVRLGAVAELVVAVNLRHLLRPAAAAARVRRPL
jgi:hypothetical protein